MVLTFLDDYYRFWVFLYSLLYVKVSTLVSIIPFLKSKFSSCHFFSSVGVPPCRPGCAYLTLLGLACSHARNEVFRCNVRTPRPLTDNSVEIDVKWRTPSSTKSAGVPLEKSLWIRSKWRVRPSFIYMKWHDKTNISGKGDADGILQCKHIVCLTNFRFPTTDIDGSVTMIRSYIITRSHQSITPPSYIVNANQSIHLPVKVPSHRKRQ